MLVSFMLVITTIDYQILNLFQELTLHLLSFEK